MGNPICRLSNDGGEECCYYFNGLCYRFGGVCGPNGLEDPVKGNWHIGGREIR